MNRLKALLIVSSLAGAMPALAGTDDVCWNRDIDRMDFYTNPASRGDNSFFSFTVSGTANVTMIYPGTASMRQLIRSLYEIKQTGLSAGILPGNMKGCQDAYALNSLDYFMPGTIAPPAAPAACLGKYNPAIQYPEPEQAYAGGGGLADNFESGASATTCTATSYNSNATDGTGGLAWQYLQWPANDSGTASPAIGSIKAGTIDASCAAASGTTSGNDFVDCQKCVSNKGYWINYNLAANPSDNNPAKFVAKGNWLNFSPPKWAMLRLGYKRLVNGPLLNPLREGIGTQNGSAGWYRLQKMLPQSCSGAGRPNQRIGSTDSVTYNNSSNPLAEMLFNVAWTVSSQGSTPPSTWGFFTASGTHPSSEPGVSSESNKKAGFCPGCNAGFSVIFSDGRGIDGWQNCDSAQYLLGTVDPSFPAYCKNSNGTLHDSHAACSGSTATGQVGLGLGAENDGNDFLDPNLSGGAGPVITQSTAPFYTTAGGVCQNDWLTSVAAWMFATDLASNSTSASADVPGTNLRLYSVGIGDNYFGELNTLQAAASAGHGLFINASNFLDLENSINKVFLDILSKATSFSVAAITTVQTRGTTFAFIPRFRPLGGAQWEGRLYRFRLFNEFAAGCSNADLTCGADGGPCKTALNPNGNNSCNDIYLEDANNNFVGEDDGGSFIVLDSTQPFGDAGFPPKTPKTAAAPVWEAANILGCRENNFLAGISSTCDDGGTSIAARNIYTVGLDAGIPNPGATLVRYNDFTNSGVTTMTDYMKLSGVNSDFCIGMSSTTRHAYATEQDCGKDLMKFVDGQDVLVQNTDGGKSRPNILGDIFHSSPILVTPPAPTFLCETGIISQCVRTLYAQDQNGGFTPNSQAAYATYFSNNSARQELIVVGADDGMLHAFQAGTSHGDAGFDDGTGVETWAFIPPDVLPKLQHYALSQSHNVLLDGTPWVRDIWKDGSGSSAANQQKDPDEFHTIAIVGEREGGRHYTAIDVTDTSSPPKFLWTWPPPGSIYELTEGESWNDTTPNPPPIGPVLIQDALGKISSADGGTASETWVVAISGGYDPNLVRGRAIYVLDAWTGALLYKFSRYDTSGTCTSGAACSLGSVAAPVSMVDTNFDNFFDLAVVGDTSGQVWSIDMLNPGNIAGTPALVNNWFGGRTFQQFKAGTEAQRAPFFTMAGARVFNDSKGGVRVYLGSGDRDQIKVRDTDAADGGTCVLDNLRGCLRNGCTVDVQQNTYQIGSGTAESFTGEWSNASTPVNTFTTAGTAGSAGACNDPAQVALRYTVNCGGTLMTDPTLLTSPVNNTMLCDFDGGSDAGEECTDVSGKPVGANAAFASPTITNTRFYSMKIFDAPGYTARPRMIDPTSSNTYNSNTMTDTDLTDVTDGGAIDGGGWFVRHTTDQNEKTASAALLLGGCVAWNTEVPSVIFTGVAADGGQVCAGGVIPTDTALLYQANDDTGTVQCGLAGSATSLTTARYQARQVSVTPQQPTPVVSLNAKTGQAGYSGVSLEPGGKIPLQVSVGAASVQGDVSWLDVSRPLHICRHPGDAGPAVCN